MMKLNCGLSVWQKRLPSNSQFLMKRTQQKTGEAGQFIKPYPTRTIYRTKTNQNRYWKLDNVNRNYLAPLTYTIINLFQRPWDFWPNFRSIYCIKWETRFFRLNLIIGLIFSRRKKGPIRKDNSVLCILQVYDFPFFTIVNKYLL